MQSPASSSSTVFPSAVDSGTIGGAAECSSVAPGDADQDAGQRPSLAIKAVVESVDLLHMILLSTADTPQHVAINWEHMAKSLPVWQTMEWAHLARKSHRQPDTPTILFAALRRWWGGQLRTFAAQGCPVTCELLTDQFCAVLAQHAPKLQALRLSSCYRITDVGLTTLARGSSLTHLELTCCGQAITANGLLTLASHAPALESLVVSSGHEGNGLLSVDDAAVGSLVSYCPSLHTVGLNDCGVGDAGLQAIAQVLGPRLRCLQLNHTRAWSQQGLLTALAQCPALTSLSIAGSPCVADSALVSLLAQCSSLQHLDVSRCSNVSLDGAHTCPYRANMTIHMMHLQHVSTYTGVWVALQGAAAAAAGIATGIAGGGAGAGGGPLTVAAYGCPGGEAARERLLARVAASNMQQLLAGSARVVTMLL